MKKPSKVNISFTIESVFKRDAVALVKKDKDTLSALLRGLLCDYLYEREVIHLRPSVVRLLEQAKKDFEEKKNISGPLHSIEEVMSHLNSSNTIPK